MQGAEDMENVLDILVVNINNLTLTQDLVKDVMAQDTQYLLTVVDQGSTEPGTTNWLDIAETFSPRISIIRNDSNISLSRLWNNHYRSSQCKYLCFLNNDMRVPHNFVSDTVKIFEAESTVGAVVHTTNHPDFSEPTALEYVIYDSKFCQGWDFSIRKEAYTPVPDTIKTFGGDDYVYWHMYEAGWKAAVALSSPVTHFHAKSRQYYDGDREEDTKNTKELVPERMPYYNRFTRKKPCPA